MHADVTRVPLDYANATLGDISLSLARYNATNQTARIGTILVNPGGPGGSGVGYLYRAAQRLSDILDGRYDIVSGCIPYELRPNLSGTGGLGPSGRQRVNVRGLYYRHMAFIG